MPHRFAKRIAALELAIGAPDDPFPTAALITLNSPHPQELVGISVRDDFTPLMAGESIDALSERVMRRYAGGPLFVMIARYATTQRPPGTLQALAEA